MSKRANNLKSLRSKTYIARMNGINLPLCVSFDEEAFGG